MPKANQKEREWKEMKKLIALLMALVMCLSLCACGDATPSEETTVKTLEELKAEARYLSDIPELTNWAKSNGYHVRYPYPEIKALYGIREENPLIFKNTYVDKPYYVTGYVHEISEEYVRISVEKNASMTDMFNLKVYLANKGDLLTVKKDWVVTVVGILREWPGGIYCYLDSAYIVERNGK